MLLCLDGRSGNDRRFALLCLLRRTGGGHLLTRQRQIGAQRVEFRLRLGGGRARRLHLRAQLGDDRGRVRSTRSRRGKIAFQRRNARFVRRPLLAQRVVGGHVRRRELGGQLGHVRLRVGGQRLDGGRVRGFLVGQCGGRLLRDRRHCCLVLGLQRAHGLVGFRREVQRQRL